MKIIYTDKIDGLTPQNLEGGFFVGWQKKVTPAQHLGILINSYKAWVAIDEATGNVVGFINAISDGVLSAYIPLLEVLPTYQRQGIGKELIRLMIADLSKFYMVDVICDENVQPFYESFGMFRHKSMILRNHE